MLANPQVIAMSKRSLKMNCSKFQRNLNSSGKLSFWVTFLGEMPQCCWSWRNPVPTSEQFNQVLHPEAKRPRDERFRAKNPGFWGSI